MTDSLVLFLLVLRAFYHLCYAFLFCSSKNWWSKEKTKVDVFFLFSKTPSRSLAPVVYTDTTQKPDVPMTGKEELSPVPATPIPIEKEYLAPPRVISPLVTTYRTESVLRTQSERERDRLYQPTPPYYATFMYLWSQNPLTNSEDLINPNMRATQWKYWEDDGAHPPKNWSAMYLPDLNTDRFEPEYELYDSGNKRVIEWQLSLLQKAKMDVAFVSWWGKDHRSDTVFRYIVTDEMNREDTPYPRLRFGLIYEPDLRGDKSAAQIEEDLRYIINQYGNQPAMLKIGGAPVIFAYGLENNDAKKVAKISEVTQKLGIHYVAQVYEGYDDTTVGVNDWIQYAPSNRIDRQKNHSISISPGFMKKGEQAPRLARNANAFTAAVKTMVQAPVRWKLVTTFNEIGEGTGIEPAVPVTSDQAGNAIPDTSRQRIGNEIDILAQQIPARR